jgi:hypothetical protein
MGFSFQYSPLTQKVVEFAGAPIAQYTTVSTVAATKSFSSITIPSNFIGSLKYVYADLIFGIIQNTNAAANYVDGSQEIQAGTAASGYTKATDLGDQALYIQGITSAQGIRVYGNTDIHANVQIGSAVYFRWLDALVKQNNMVLYFVQPILRVILE